MEEFKDHFSKQSNIYAKYRPQYTPALFEFLSSLVDAHDTAWDCATGNGQAALGLAPHFDNVVATDASKEQIAHAIPNAKISYLVCPANRTSISSGTIDLATIAQAVHWLNFKLFYAEVSRVLKPRGVIAVWGYGLMHVNSGIDTLIREYHDSIVASYWPLERRYIDDEYSTIPFPFDEMQSPIFSIEQQWDMGELMGYLETWSSAKRFFEERQFQPTNIIRNKLHELWEDDPSTKKLIRWPLFMRVGRKSM